MLVVPALALLLAAAVPQEPGATIDRVAVRVHGPLELARLLAAASDVDDHARTRDGSVVIYADDAEQARLAAQGFDLAVLQQDVAGFFAARAAAERGLAPGAGSMGGFRTLSEILAKMDDLAASHPAIVSPRFSIGTSVEGRPIWAMRISDNPTVDEPDEPVAWFDALHHAREPMSGESLLLFADELATGYPADPVVRRIVESRNVVFVPCVNPDGYAYNEQTHPNGGGLWRKNRRNNGDGTIGVDLNRNYGWEWGPQWPGGSSGSTSNDLYRGPSPFSEPETQAVRDAMALHPPGMAASAHSASDLWLFAWGYDTILAPDDALLRHYPTQFAASGWLVGTPWQVLYLANGTALDWGYGALGTLAYTPEIGTSQDSFWPAPSRIPELYAEVRPGYLSIARNAGGWAEEPTLHLAEVLGDGDQSVERGEIWEVVLDLVDTGVGPIDGTLTASSTTPDVQVIVATGPVHADPWSPAAPLAAPPPATPPVYAGQGWPLITGRRTHGPLVRIADTAADGLYTLDLALTYDTAVDDLTLDVLVGEERVLARDDAESPIPGWQVSNPLVEWAWERAVPQQTASTGQIAQPGTDDPAGSGTMCWVTGAAAGAFAAQRDVDGVTVLTSPHFSTLGFDPVVLEYARWFANLPSSGSSPLDDVLRVEVSRDGGSSWTELEATGNDNAWRTVSFRLHDFVAPSADMVLRFTAADDPDNDLTEACIDDVVLHTVSSLPTLALWGTPAAGSTPRLFAHGPAAASYRVRISTQAGAGTSDPGTAGLSYLEGLVQDVATGTADAEGVAAVDWTVPAGTTLYLQGLFDEGGPQAAWSNLLTVAVQ
jgi:carboxypeptidase T